MPSSAPVLLVQGRRLFQTMPRLQPPTGDAAGTTGEGRPLRLLVVGDSAAAGYGAETLGDALPGQLARRLAGTGRRVAWSMFARFGSTAARTRAFVAKQEPVDTDLVVISLGLNDLIGGARQADWLADMRALVADLRAVRRADGRGVRPAARRRLPGAAAADALGDGPAARPLGRRAPHLGGFRTQRRLRPDRLHRRRAVPGRPRSPSAS